jgi:glycosyltransferase involved in cell wall biosynthesis
VSLGTTFGWRHADASLVRMLQQAGYRCEVRPVRVGARAGKLRRTMAGTDLVEALAARRAAAGAQAPAVIFSSITAALLQRPPVPYAVRFDTIAALGRPGITGAWQRAREPRVLARARLLLPWSEAAARTARELVEPFSGHPRIITLPVPIERLNHTAERDIDAVAYCADPRKRGLDLLCDAWRALAWPNARLIVGGVDQAKADCYLSSTGTRQPPGIEWAGDLARDAWLDRVARARVFINASRYEDWGIAQLEALASGTPLVTVPSSGPYEALPLARRLAPELVTNGRQAEALATAIAAGLDLTDADRASYAASAGKLLEPYRPEVIERIVAQEVAPALLGDRRSS